MPPSKLPSPARGLLEPVDLSARLGALGHCRRRRDARCAHHVHLGSKPECGCGLLCGRRPHEAADLLRQLRPSRDHRAAVWRFGRGVSGPAGTPRCSRATGLAPSPRGDLTCLPASPARERTPPRSHQRRPQAPHVEGAIPRSVHRAGPETTGLARHDRFDAVPQDEAPAERTTRYNAFKVIGAMLADCERHLRPARPSRPTDVPWASFARPTPSG
jgi:hypothetical protein